MKWSIIQIALTAFVHHGQILKLNFRLKYFTYVVPNTPLNLLFKFFEQFSFGVFFFLSFFILFHGWTEHLRWCRRTEIVRAGLCEWAVNNFERSLKFNNFPNCCLSVSLPHTQFWKHVTQVSQNIVVQEDIGQSTCFYKKVWEKIHRKTGSSFVLRLCMSQWRGNIRNDGNLSHASTSEIFSAL